MNLQIQNLCDSRRIKVEDDLLEELTRLPQTLVGMYSLILENISQIEQHGRSVAESALKWLLCTKDSSSITTIAACSAITLTERRTLSIQHILDLCSNLVVYDEALDRFRFAHLSVQEFLESRPGYTPSEVNQSIAKRSLQILMSAQPEVSKMVRLYATCHWTYHYQKLEEQCRKEFFEHCAKRFFFNGAESSEVYELWAAKVSPGSLYRASEEKIFSIQTRALLIPMDIARSPVLLACRFGWLEHLEHYETYQVINGSSTFAKEMMSVAISHGSASVVRWLLARRFCPTDEQLKLALHFKQTEILQILLAEDSISCNMLEHGEENLVLAVRYDLKCMYQALIKKGANFNCRDQEGQTLLFHALRNSSKDSEILEDLLLKGVDPLARDEAGKTPLSLSILGLYQQHTYDLSTGFDYEPSLFKDGEKTLEHVLSSYEHRTACLLVRYGTDSMMRDVSIRFQWMSILDSIAILPTLQSDTSVSGSTRSGRQASTPDDTMQGISQTLLSLAALYHHEKAFRVLLDLGTDPTCPAIREAQKKTSTVTYMGHSLNRQQNEGRQHRRNPNKMIDELRQGPLAWAAYTGNLSLVQSILHQDMDLNIQNRNGQTALYFAAQQVENKYSHIDLEADKEATVRLLIRKGALVTSADAYGGATVLAHAFKARYSNIVQVLLENRAQIPKDVIRGPVKRLWDTFEHGREGIREALLERVQAAEIYSLDLQPPNSLFGWTGDPVSIAAQLILGGTMRLLGDAILAACEDMIDATPTELLPTQQ